MAKTTSQIIAENKIKRAEAAAIAASRDKIHQQQMAGVAEKAAAKTLAVLNKAISGTADPTKKSELSRAAQMVTDEYKKASSQQKTGPKTATDMQKKKEDQAEEKHPVDSLQIRKDRAQKALDDFDNNKEIDWTDTNQRKAYDAERKRLQDEVDRAGAEIDAREDARTHDTNMERIAAMSIEDREQLQQYIESRDARRSVFANPISWYQDYNKETENKNALIDKYGEEELAELAEIYSRHLHEQNAKKTVEETQESVNQNWIAAALHNIAAVPARAMGGIEAMAGRLYEQVDRTGQYRTLEENTAGDTLSLYGNAVSGQTAQNIAGENGNVVRGALSIGYQGVMSVVDSIARTFFGGGAAGGAALAATNSFTQTVSEATKQGASPQQAVTLGVGKAGIEYLTEKYSIDEVFKFAKTGDTKVWQAAFKQAGVEITTEELTLFSSMAAEAAILREKSSYKLKISELVANGKSYEEAKAQADNDVWNEALQTAAVSGFAGGLSGGGAAIVGNLATNNVPEVTAEAPQEVPVEVAPAAPAVDEGQQIVDAVTAEPSSASLVDGIQDMTPAPVPLTEGQRDVMAAMDGTLGNQPAQQPVIEPAAPQEETAYQDEFEDWGKDPNREGVENPLSDRSYSEVGKRSVKAYMYENPAVKPFYQEQAAWLLSELADSTKGERTYNEQLHYESGGEQGWSGTKRNTSESIAELLDQDGMSYDQIERGLNAIVNDHGQENNAVSKRIEFVINDRLMNGYTDFYTGEKVPGNAEYLNLLRNQQSAPDVDTSEAAQMGASNIQQQSTEDAQENTSGTVGAKESQFRHEVKQSKVYGNTYQNTPYADIHDIGRAAKKADPNIDQYDVITEAESVHEAELRTETGRDRLVEHHALLKKDGWTGADNDTAMRLLTTYRREGKKERFIELSRKQRQMATQSGQMVQSFAKYSREDATVAVQDAIEDLDELTIDQVDRKFWKPEQKQKGSQGKKDAFQKWKESITGSLLEVANDIENVEDGDKASMKDLVRQIANLRHTTAWAGYSSDLSRRTERGLDKMDFDTLKTVAKTQLSMIPNDFRKRDTGEIIKQIRMQNMLFTLTTKFKNDAGNITNGIMDAVSDSFGGRMFDAIIGKFTGQRTVGNDLKFAREYSKAARDAGDVAAAFVSLDIPMETDAKYSSGRTRTWTPNTSNMFGRLMSAYEKHMKYALEVSDKFYEGGAAHVVSRSLESLGEKSGLTPEQIQDIAQKTGERRTFKDPSAGINKDGTPKNGRAFARTNVGLQKALNNIGTDNIGLGDLLMPFAAVSGEVKQVGMDYTGGGLISGMSEMIQIIKDARNGKEIDPYRQRTAATNFGRGMTGVGLIAAFAGFAAAGAIKVHNDRDSEERMMNQTQGLSGAQWNLDSSMRWWETITGGGTAEQAAKAAEWKSGDELISIDFLEPFNTQMHVGYLLSQDKDLASAILQGNFDALLEMPMMQTFSDLADLAQAFTEISDGDMSGVKDAAGQLVGTVAGSIVPNWMRKTAQIVDPFYRDTYDTNPFQKAGKEVMAAIPGLSATLPKKYDNLGKEQRRFDDSEWMTAAFDNLVTPWDTNTYQTNPVYQEIERLNAIEGINVTPPQAKRKITYTDNTGKEHQGYNLSAEQYEIMQQVQGQTTMRLLADITADSDYNALDDLQKAEVYSNLYAYAQEQAKREALPDYFSESAAWMDNISGDVVKGLIQRAALAPINSNVGDIVDAIENGWAVDPAAQEELETLYDSYSAMSKESREQILENAISDTAKYLEIRSRGISTDQYIDVVGDIKVLEPEPTYTNIRDIQIREAIAENDSLSKVEKDFVMKAYMTDYDPNAKSPEKTELKYDAIRELGVSPDGYTAAYRAYLDASGTGKRRRTIAQYMKSYGWDRSTAQKVYDIYAGYYKPWE